MIRICIFCEKWGSGGIESFLLSALSHMDREHLDIQILTPYIESKAYLPKLERLGICLKVLSSERGSSFIQFKTFYKAFRDGAYDAAHFNLYEGLALGYVKAAEMAGIPVRIVHSHNTDLRKSFLKPVKLAIHHMAKVWFGNAATFRLACSSTAAEFLFEREIISEKRWELMRNGIETSRFTFDAQNRKRMREELGVCDEFVVGCVGRLCYQKNQSFLLRVFARLHSRNPQSLLVLVGEGEDERMLCALSDSLGVRNAVVFYGVTDRVPELLAAFDVLAFPSVFEGLGIAAIEAQAAGLSVLCSERVPQEVAITDLAEFLSLDAGEDCWAERLLSCQREERKDMRAEIVRAGYDIGDVAQKLRSLWTTGRDR